MNCTIRSLYLCVRDMERAVRFYEDFLERLVTCKDELYSVFDISGFRLGLFAYEKAGENHIFGSNCLPSLEVDSLEDPEEEAGRPEGGFCMQENRNKLGVGVCGRESEGNPIEPYRAGKKGGGMLYDYR